MKRIITQADVNERIRSGESIIFLDARSDLSWMQSNVKLPGAVRMPPSTPLVAEIKALPRDRTIVAYCSCPNEEDSARAADLLSKVGFTSVYALAGGIESWQQVGLPVEPKDARAPR